MARVTIIWIVSGLFGWTLLEYALHRYLGHAWSTRFRARHLRHHDNPKANSASIDFVWISIGSVLILSSAMIAASLAYFSVGCVLGYLNYERIHRRAHSSYAYYAYWRHALHHINPIANFGVTFALWDYLLGTASDE